MRGAPNPKPKCKARHKRTPEAGQVWKCKRTGVAFLRIHEGFGVAVWVSLSGCEMANTFSDGDMVYAAGTVEAYYSK